ncbi:MAG: RNA polymerase sigma factor [Nannocystaceae bacterium]|nr:RNA polymerase sigma factor [bacterium]
MRDATDAAVSEAYAAMFRAHYGKVVRWLSVLGVSRAAVDDVAQEVFIVAHRKFDQLRPDASTSGWLMAIARNVAATHKRGEGRARAREQHASAPAQSPSPEATAMRNQAAALLQEFLDTLPEEQRLVFAMVELDGSSGSEVAEALGISRHTVHSRLRLIREKLARRLARQQARSTDR